jgi:hypothetical protein
MSDQLGALFHDRLLWQDQEIRYSLARGISNEIHFMAESLHWGSASVNSTWTFVDVGNGDCECDNFQFNTVAKPRPF